MMTLKLPEDLARKLQSGSCGSLRLHLDSTNPSQNVPAILEDFFDLFSLLYGRN